MALQRVRSLATTKFIDENTANAYTPAAGEMISIFVHGTYRGLRIGDGSTVGGLSLVNTDLAELYEYIGEPDPKDVELPDRTIQYCNSKRPATYCRNVGKRRRWEIALKEEESVEQFFDSKTLWKFLSQWVSQDEAIIESCLLYTSPSPRD